MRRALMVGFLLVFGWMTFAESPPLDTKQDITCYKDKEILFKLKIGSVRHITMSNTYENVMEGNIQTDNGAIFLPGAFPYLEVESNANMIIVEPTMTNPFTGMVLETPLDMEITIDLFTHIGRFSAVTNSAQAVACAACDNATVVECTN